MRRFVLLATLVTLALAGIGGMAVPVAAIAPPPRDACLRSGAFNIAERICQAYSPAWGAQFGPISGIQVVEAPRGVPIPLAIPGGQDVGFGPQPGEVCGERGCPRNGTLWRVGGPFAKGLGLLEGCGVQDVTCTVVSNPPLIGDRGEVYQVVYGQVYHGIIPTSTSRMWALYTPPTIYPVELTPVDTGGARLALGHDVVAYAVHERADPAAADCVELFWYTSVLDQPAPPVPDCVAFRRGGDIYSLEGTFEGWLPVDSGSWTIVADPRGDPGAPLRSRPSGYSQVTVTPVGDDIATTIVGLRRPSLSLQVAAATDEMALGSSQSVEVVVTADGGEAGWLEGLRFTDPAILSVETLREETEGAGAVLTAAAPEDGPPAEGFRLDPGESRRFLVQLDATALGTAEARVFVSGKDDLGTPLAVDQGGPVLVTQDGPAVSAEAPRPPVVAEATDQGPGSADRIAGTVDGAPGTTVSVAIVVGTRATPDECLRQMRGPAVTALGTLDVTIGADGTGTFSLAGPLEIGQDVYGQTTSGAVVSAVGACLPVEAADADSGPVDLRGEWRITDNRNGLVGTMTITRQHPDTGKVVGTARGQGLSLKVTGTLRGTRLTLTFAADGQSTTGTGKVMVQDGRVTVLLRSRDGNEFALLTKVKPAEG